MRPQPGAPIFIVQAHALSPSKVAPVREDAEVLDIRLFTFDNTPLELFGNEVTRVCSLLTKQTPPAFV
jgi:hypothetical protein